MKIIASVLALLTVLSVSIFAQSATEPVLKIKRVAWFENVSPIGCNDCGPMPEIAKDYIIRHRAGYGDFSAMIVLKNLSAKSIKSISLEFVFRDSATESEFLTYNFRFEQKIGRGRTKELRHKIEKDKEPDNFRPAGPSDELVGRTRACGDSPLFGDRRTGKLVRIRDDANLLKRIPCYYTSTVTRIEYTDGSVWQP